MRTLAPTPAQLETLELLKPRLAEISYLNAPVAPAYRRLESDAVLIPKLEPRHFLIMRIAPTCIVIRPMGEKRSDIVRLIKKIGYTLPTKVRIAAPQLPFARRRSSSWRDFVDPSAHQEIETLIGSI